MKQLFSHIFAHIRCCNTVCNPLITVEIFCVKIGMPFGSIIICSQTCSRRAFRFYTGFPSWHLLRVFSAAAAGTNHFIQQLKSYAIVGASHACIRVSFSTRKYSHFKKISKNSSENSPHLLRKTKINSFLERQKLIKYEKDYIVSKTDISLPDYIILLLFFPQYLRLWLYFYDLSCYIKLIKSFIFADFKAWFKTELINKLYVLFSFLRDFITIIANYITSYIIIYDYCDEIANARRVDMWYSY